MTVSRIHIKPEIFAWAIERAGRSVEEYKSENVNFEKWLNGEKLPTLKNVEDFAKKFYVPLGYMFLDSPPQETCPIPFFRSTRDTRNDINVYDTVLTMQERQDWLSGYLQRNGFDKASYVGAVKDNNEDFVCNYLYGMLNLSPGWAFDFNTTEEALRYITTIIEDKGIIVCYNGVVGFNNNRHISVKECRGFALVDDYAPFIFINNKDAKSAQMFTLIHELVHILIGYSAGIGDGNLQDENSNIERFCDTAAANFLVPEFLLKEEWNKLGENYEYLSKRFKVSKFVIARRAKNIGLITKNRYFELYDRWERENVVTNKKSGGGDFIPNAIKKTSRTFLIHVNNAISGNQLLHMEAYRLTGLKGDTFHKIINSPKFLR